MKKKIDTGPLKLLERAQELRDMRHRRGEELSPGFQKLIEGLIDSICDIAGFDELIAYDAITGEVTGCVKGEREND